MSEEKKELSAEELEDVAGGARWGHPIDEFFHNCPKCGARVVGNNKDELCDSCRLADHGKIEIPRLRF